MHSNGGAGDSGSGGVDSRNIRMKDEKQTPPSNFVAVNQLSTTASRLQAGAIISRARWSIDPGAVRISRSRSRAVSPCVSFHPSEDARNAPCRADASRGRDCERERVTCAGRNLRHAAPHRAVTPIAHRLSEFDISRASRKHVEKYHADTTT